MDLYVKLIYFINSDTANSAMYLYCYLFIILNFAHLGIQDDRSISSMSTSHYKHGENRLHFKPEEKYKKFEIQYSLKNVWDIINKPQYAAEPVVKKIREMWANTKPPKIRGKKPRKKMKNITTTTPDPSKTSAETEPITTTELCETTTRVRLPGRQNPYVLVEGTLTRTRRALVKGLVKHTTFVYVRNFRKFPFKYGDKFNTFDLHQLKRAFVNLQFYITGRDVEKILEERPVIMCGFWMRHAVEFLSWKYQDITNLPPVGSECYNWPADLVKPDLVLFLHTPRTDGKLSEDTVKRHERMVEIYQRMNPPVIVLDDTYNKNTTEKQFTQLRKMIIEKLVQKYPYANDIMKYKKSTPKPLLKGSGKNNTAPRQKKQKAPKHVAIKVNSLKNNSTSD